MNIPLLQIRTILDDPDFDLMQALDKHKASLKIKRNQITTTLNTIEKTIDHLKHKAMLNYE